ncbi:MAG: VanW family protein [Lachnospiraceae bacterium]|nr:VanW family protein [Lachnospiraceae bacterium]
MGRKLFCQINPTCYRISTEKEIIKRKCKDLFTGGRFAKEHRESQLPVIVKSHSSVMVRRLNGVDLRLQENKVTNIELACEKINGIVVHPGEVFSFWRTVGRPTARKGYKEGLNIRQGKLSSGIGGGLCQMANMIHWLVLNSSLKVTELHHHSDALFPDERRRVPFGTGTSVCYNNRDYRFRNNLDTDVQILVWCENGELCGELRAINELPYRYRLFEEDSHYHKEGDKYYRISKVYRSVIDRKSGEEIRKELILDNHSEVVYDYSLIPEEEIR